MKLATGLDQSFAQGNGNKVWLGLVFTPQLEKALGYITLFSPMASGWAGAWWSGRRADGRAGAMSCLA